MENIRNAVRVVQSTSPRETSGVSKFGIEESKAVSGLKNDRGLKSKTVRDIENDRGLFRIKQITEQSPVTVCAEVNTMPDLHTKAIEINSADEVRQAFKAALAKKPMTANQSVATEMRELVLSLPNENPVPMETPKEVPQTKKVRQTKEVTISEIQEYKPESGDQVHTQKSRKRRGNPTQAGPSKRSRTKAEIIDNFYVGKLCNLVTFTKKFSPSDSDFDERPFMSRPYYGHIWKRFFPN